MSIEKFKKFVAENEQISLGMDYVANVLRNSYELYDIDREIKHSTLVIESCGEDLEDEEAEEFYFEWEHIYVHSVFRMLNNLGMSSELIKNQIYTTQTCGDGILFSKLEFKNVWNIIKPLSPTEMCYAFSTIMNSINEESNIYKYMIAPFRKALKSYLDDETLEQLSSNFTEYVFVAMWFDESMTKYKDKIVKSIEKCGYIAKTISDKEYNGSIVPEILYEIKKCKFMVADFTGNRGSVYYEAGYAEAIGKKVIQCCKKDELVNLQFDVSHIKTIEWSDEKDLEQKLINRISATIN